MQCPPQYVAFNARTVQKNSFSHHQHRFCAKNVTHQWFGVSLRNSAPPNTSLDVLDSQHASILAIARLLKEGIRKGRVHRVRRSRPIPRREQVQLLRSFPCPQSLLKPTTLVYPQAAGSSTSCRYNRAMWETSMNALKLEGSMPGVLLQ